MSRDINLANGTKTIVDDEDFESLNKYKWCAVKGGNTYYAQTKQGRIPFRKTLSMHRVITGAEKGFDVDHRNGNGLDNRKSNLRVCKHTENSKNRIRNTDNASGYKGVSLHSKNNRWVSYITHNGERKYIGSFDTAEVAAKEYDKVARKLFGEFANTNFEE